jgi:hypothetical protein
MEPVPDRTRPSRRHRTAAKDHDGDRIVGTDERSRSTLRTR